MTITGYAFEVESVTTIKDELGLGGGTSSGEYNGFSNKKLIPPISYLHINKNMKLEQYFYPNWWIRFWHKVLLGWKWEKVAYYDSH